ncbi:MAG: BON domain-containing protein [Drouetiella hepatica Uher 2000/2452]|jgi:osmotically-inducible protein OsmY|uniref:BON domain-containing protein n=1 Tax=Drouetiella hepatica Uher 2000/2452 TaxID=904376 RepID=A0A951ULQ5_9CYAN|nr:BON domain-containing protein [Drouetiella hepatica Uher 2000/2452]
MKKIVPFLLSGFLMVTAAACSTAKTTSDAPNSTDNSGQVPTAQGAQTAQDDAQNDVRQRQLDSDIRSREQRNNATGGDADRADGDLESEVRSKLEANIPNSKLAVDAEDGAVVVSGTVQTQDQLDKIEPLAKEIKGVSSVAVKAVLAPAQ